jgi:hypothetical protein
MKARVAVAAGCAVVTFSMSLQAHHGYADFKQDKVISVQGTLQRVDWANPHTTLTCILVTGCGNARNCLKSLDILGHPQARMPRSSITLSRKNILRVRDHAFTLPSS